jgi:transcriptional regulator MraZ
MLTGTYIYGMDRKGRVVMPATFRQALGAPFVLTRAPGPALLALSSPQWRMLLDRYERSILFRGYYLSAAVECGFDENTGRFLVPHALREYAGLRPMDEVAVTGIGRAVQVIKRTRWDESVQRGEFPSLGQLDLDIEVPRLEESQPFRYRMARPLGLPLVEARGRLDGRALRRLATALSRLLEESPRVVVLDVRQSGEATTAVPLLANLMQPLLQNARSQLWVVGALGPSSNGSLQVFSDLESVLWKLAELDR